MTYWMYGIAFVAVALVIGTLKAGYQARLIAAVLAIGFLVFLKINSKKR